MNYIIDTHVFLWALEDDPRLSTSNKQLLESPDHIAFFSITSLWEMSIKMSLGKLEPKRVITHFIDEHLVAKGVQVLPIQAKHLDQLSLLSLHHRDPFDRLLIAQAMTENMPILTSYNIFKKYNVALT